jgi:hypothetical protein
MPVAGLFLVRHGKIVVSDTSQTRSRQLAPE